MKKIILKPFLLLTIIVFIASSCKKSYLDTKPSDGVLQDTILSNTNALISVSDGNYSSLFAFGANGGVGRHDNYGQKSVDLSMDLMGNDMVVHTLGYGWYNAVYQYTNWTLASSTNSQCDMFWYFYYSIIKNVNKLLGTIDVANGSQSDKEALKGQALALRAHCYYMLANLYQQTYKGNETKPGVPIYTSIAVVGNPRGTVQQTYNQIISDLTSAEQLLTGKNITAKNVINVRVVQGMRARVALVMEDWATAASYANKARQGYTLMDASTYTSTSAFSSISNPEWMWGSLITAAQATIYASFFSHMDIRTGGYAALGGQKKITKILYDQIATGDVRKLVFTAPASGTSSNPAYNQVKLQVPVAGSWAADYLYMRAGEMYLIEAEALARQNQDANAKTVLETLIKTRYPAYSASSFSGTTLLNEILLQRRIELWGEGFSLIDVKRLKLGLNRPTGTGNHGSPSLDPIVYILPDGSPRFLAKIPQRELDNNQSMTPADQNP